VVGAGGLLATEPRVRFRPEAESGGEAPAWVQMRLRRPAAVMSNWACACC
jgi:hypothetical protein